jgi:hypothetical protein
MRFFVALCALAAVLAASPVPAFGAGEEQLPDFYQEIPYNLQVEQYGSGADAVFHLGFGSTVYNFGDGQLKVEGSRASTATPTMTVDQVVSLKGGGEKRYPGIGQMAYVDSVTHRHWHYLKWDTYSLETTSGKLARPDQKTGFCLGDRFIAKEDQTLPGQPSGEVFGDNCGYDQPDLLNMTAGISVNYGDAYVAQVEGQFVDITDVPAGRYRLVHRVNADRKLKEKNYADDVASVLVDISWPGGFDVEPKVTQVARCAVTAACPIAPEISASKAAGYAKTAVADVYRGKGVSAKCHTVRHGKYSCDVAWRGGKKATATIASLSSRGKLYWSYSLKGKGLKSKSGKVALAEKPKAVPFHIAGQETTAQKAAAFYCVLPPA